MSATHRLLRFGVFELNLDTEELRKFGTPVKLRPQPFQLLALLASHAGQVVSREEIQKSLWGEDTYVDFEHGMNRSIQQIRTVLSDDADHPLYIETLPRHGYRFLAPVTMKTVLAPVARVKESSSGTPASLAEAIRTRLEAKSQGGAAEQMQMADVSAVAPQPLEIPQAQVKPRRRSWPWIVSAGCVVFALLLGGLYLRTKKTAALTEKDTIVLADFDNKTGDSVFDGTLRQALWVALDQSPYLNIVSDQRIAQTMTLMAEPEGAALTPALAQEVCVRTGSTATVEGAIAMLGSDYVIGLKVVNCSSGEILAAEQFTVDRKEEILPYLGKNAARVRSKLGESSSSLTKFNRPLEEATTPSLEALRALTQGRKAMRRTDDIPAAIGYYKRALELDPNFASAYVSLGIAYGSSGEDELSVQNVRKAFALRNRTSERERFNIESTYYGYTGEWEKAAAIDDEWATSYPGDYSARNNFSVALRVLGQWDQAAAAARQAHEIRPDAGQPYYNMMSPYLALNRLDNARSTYEEAQRRQLDGFAVRLARYQLAFLRRDDKAMREQLSWAADKRDIEETFVAAEASSEAYFGRLEKASQITRQAVELAQRSGASERAAGFVVEEAIWNAEIGSSARAKKRASDALKLSAGKGIRVLSAFAMARVDETAKAENIEKNLDREFPVDTQLQRYWLPSIRAALHLQRGDPNAAAEALRAASAIEVGQVMTLTAWQYPAYLRGEAYLMMHDGVSAAKEYRKFIDHPGLGVNFVTGALAYLGLARAYAEQGDTANARAAYQDFLTLWKDADPDIPIYKQAKAEYAKLR